MESMEMEETREPPRDHYFRRCYKVCCCSKYTLAIGLTFLITAGGSALIGAAVSSANRPRDVHCATVKCRAERLTNAYSVLYRLDEKVLPCDDFYQYACGGRKKNKAQLEDKDVFSTENIDEENIKYLENFIPTINRTTTRIKPFKLIKQLYDICLDTESMEKRQTSTLMEILKQVNGWPVLEGNRWNEELFKWEQLVSLQYQLGFPNGDFVRFGFIGDLADNSKLIIQIEQPDLEFPCERFIEGLQDPGIKGYYNYMVNIAVELGADRTEATKELENVFNFEKQLAEIAEFDISRRDNYGRYHLMTIKELEKTYPNIDWKTLLMRYKPDYEYRDDDRFMVKNKTYIGLLEQLITNTPKRVLANYGVWKMVIFAVPYLHPKIRKWNQIYKSTRINLSDLSGQPTLTECIYTVKIDFSQVTDFILISGNFDNSSIEKVKPIFDTMKQELIDLLKTIDWLDEYSKNYAIEKIKTLTYVIGYPKEIVNIKKLTSLFDGLTLVDGDFLQSMLNIKKFFYKNTANRMRKPYDMSSWELLPPWTDLNAYNIANHNKIMILTGYLHKNSYHVDRPNYINYGLIGATIGHELFHTLDNVGVMYDKYGHTKYWMTNESTKIFTEKVNCFIEHYNNYELAPLKKKIDGNLTVSENMADAYGTRLAYLSYKKWYEKHGPEDVLPEMSFTPNQLFWISYASGLCKDYSEKDLRENLYDPHPPHHIRVLGSLSNIPEFAEDFECRDDSKLNPPNKCTFW